MICQHFGTLLPSVNPGSIITTNRQSFDKKYLIHGKSEGFLVAAQFKHGGYIVDLDIDEFKGRYDTKSHKFSAPVRVKAAERAVIDWITHEYEMLKPLKGGLPQTE